MYKQTNIRAFGRLHVWLINACAYDLRSEGSCDLQSLSVDLCSLYLSLPVFERICVFAYTNGKDC